MAKGRTPPIEKKQKTKAILAADLLCNRMRSLIFFAFKYPVSNNSMGEKGVRLYKPTAHLPHHLHKRAEQWEHRPEIPLWNEEVKKYGEKDTNSNQETGKNKFNVILRQDRLRPQAFTGSTKTKCPGSTERNNIVQHCCDDHVIVHGLVEVVGKPSALLRGQRGLSLPAERNWGAGWMLHLRLPQTTTQGLLSKTRYVVQYQQHWFSPPVLSSNHLSLIVGCRCKSLVDWLEYCSKPLPMVCLFTRLEQPLGVGRCSWCLRPHSPKSFLAHF